MEDPRTRRLRADYERMCKLQAQSDVISFKVYDVEDGSPPEKYVATFKCRGISGIDADRRPVFSKYHQVEIYLPVDYPTEMPRTRWITPIWHPNIQHIEPYHVCINDWVASRMLDSVVLMMGEMVRYKNYHADKNTYPFVIDEEAADWAIWAENQGIISHSKPLDERPLLRPVAVQSDEKSKTIEPASPGQSVLRVKIPDSGEKPGAEEPIFRIIK